MPFQLRCWCKCWEWVSIRNVKFSSSFCQTYYCVSDISWFDWNITSICHLQACFSRKPCKKAGAPELLCLFMLTNRFLFSYREWASGISLYLFLLSVFMCSWHCLILSEHCQLKWEYATKKMQQKIVGAPEFWCLGTRTLVPPIFLTVYLLRHSNLWWDWEGWEGASF